MTGVSVAADYGDKVKPTANILVVDDEPDITTLVREKLQNEFRVSVFNNPVSALDDLRRHAKEYSLVLSDIRMPEMNGLEFVRKAKELNPDIKIVLMTAFEIHPSEFSKVIPNTHVDDFIMKPMSMSHVKEIILKHIGESKSLLQ